MLVPRSTHPKRSQFEIGNLRKWLDYYIFIAIFVAYPLSILILGHGRYLLLSLPPAFLLLPVIGFIANSKTRISFVDFSLVLFVCYLFFSAMFISENVAAAKIASRIGILFLSSYSLARIFLCYSVNMNKILLLVIGAVFLIFLYVFSSFGSVRSAMHTHDVAFGSISSWMPALILPFAPFVFFPTIKSVSNLWLSRANLFMFVTVLLLSQSRFAYLIVLACMLLKFLSFKLIHKLYFIAISAFLIIAFNHIFNIVLMDLLEPVIVRIAKYAPVVIDIFDISPENTVLARTDIRAAMISAAFPIWAENPFFGIGLNGFADIHVPGVEKEKMISHNIYIVTGLAELGVVGFCILMMVVIIAMLRPLHRLRSHGEYLAHEKSLVWKYYFGLLIVLLHAYFRPQFDNPTFFAFIIMSGWGFGPIRYLKSSYRL